MKKLKTMIFMIEEEPNNIGHIFYKVYAIPKTKARRDYDFHSSQLYRNLGIE